MAICRTIPRTLQEILSMVAEIQVRIQKKIPARTHPEMPVTTTKINP